MKRADVHCLARSRRLSGAWRACAVVALLAAVGFHCNDKGNISTSKAPAIRVEPSETSMRFVQEDSTQQLTISSVGQIPLTISEITISGGNNAFEVDLGTTTLPLELPVGQSVSINVRFKSNPIGPGTLSIRNTDPLKPLVAIQLLPPESKAVLDLSPQTINFGRVQVTTTKNELLTLKNIGSQPLVIASIIKNATDEFQLQYAKPPTFPLILQPNETYAITVTFSPKGTGEAAGEIRIESNDPRGVQKVPLVANTTGTCIVARPAAIEFGGRPLAVNSTLSLVVTSCGSEDLTITSLALAPTSASVFALRAVPQLPAKLAPGQNLIISVDFLPVAEGDYTGTLQIGSDATGLPVLEVPITGTGSPNNCPVAVIKSDPDSTEVPPQTVLKLSASDSVDPDGQVVTYKWVVVAPNDSVSVLLPSGNVPNPTFEMNIAGTYTFKLDVWDDTGQKSCNTAELVVQVVPKTAWHIELVWTAPGDLDPTDECPNASLDFQECAKSCSDKECLVACQQKNFCGPDLDLHLRHPSAGDWGDLLYDCYFSNQKPAWDDLGTLDDDPRLDRDDTDGGGPENINLDKPVAGHVYRVGVHYFTDHGFGPSEAKVRLFYYGQLVKEYSKTLKHWDFWEVATIDKDGNIVDLGTVSERPGEAY